MMRSSYALVTTDYDLKCKLLYPTFDKMLHAFLGCQTGLDLQLRNNFSDFV
jgi:hypothetical protein